nr:GNAT family N-acetyltransferase [Caulobacter hibisci]
MYDLYVQEWWTQSRQFDDVVKMISHSDIVLTRYSEDGCIIAFARVLTDFTFKAMIYDVIIAADHRGSGLGQAIVEKIFNHPLLSTVKSFELYCPERLIPFYEKLDFKRGTSVIMSRKR